MILLLGSAGIFESIDPAVACDRYACMFASTNVPRLLGHRLLEPFSSELVRKAALVSHYLKTHVSLIGLALVRRDRESRTALEYLLQPSEYHEQSLRCIQLPW